MKKYKLKQFLAATLAATMLLSTNAFATPINLTDSPADASKTDTLDKTNGTDYFADETTNVWQNGSISEEVRVTVDRASRFEITIPKEIVLNGNDGSASYNVSVTGEIAGDQVISVVPDTTFVLNEDGGKQVDVTVIQPNTDFTYQNIDRNETYNGDLSASKISAGNWSGSFYFNIEFKGESIVKTFNDYTWAEIAAISEAGNAVSTFSVGDEKELIIGSETYHVQILGFNHDDLADGSGKAGITVGLKEVIPFKSNACFPEDDLEKLNNDIYKDFSEEVKNIIKPVNKTIQGNKSCKLFTFSLAEIGTATVELPSNCTLVNIYNNEGTKYDFFTDDNSRIKHTTDLNNVSWITNCFISILDENNDWWQSGVSININGKSEFGSLPNCYISFGFCI